MSDTPTSGLSPGSSPAGPFAAPPNPWPPGPPAPGSRSGGWLSFATLAIALIGLGVGIGAWLRPMPETGSASLAREPIYTDEQIAAAKANICEAYRVVDRSVVMNTRRTNPVPGDEIGALATEVYGELALYQGGDYLLDQLSTEQATPANLANLIKSLGNTLKEFGMIVLAGEPESLRDPLRHVVDTDSAEIESLCK